MEGKEQRQRIETLSYELELTQSQLKDLRETNKGLDTNKFSQEKSLTEYMLKLQAGQRTIEDKEQIIQKLNALIDNMKQQKEVIE